MSPDVRTFSFKHFKRKNEFRTPLIHPYDNLVNSPQLDVVSHLEVLQDTGLLAGLLQNERGSHGVLLRDSHDEVLVAMATVDRLHSDSCNCQFR